MRQISAPSSAAVNILFHCSSVSRVPSITSASSTVVVPGSCLALIGNFHVAVDVLFPQPAAPTRAPPSPSAARAIWVRDMSALYAKIGARRRATSARNGRALLDELGDHVLDLGRALDDAVTLRRDLAGPERAVHLGKSFGERLWHAGLHHRLDLPLRRDVDDLQLLADALAELLDELAHLVGRADLIDDFALARRRRERLGDKRAD